MRFDLLDSISIPGNPDKPNEDAFAHTDKMAVVFDGVTAISDPLMPGKSDPAWLAQFAARRVVAHSTDGGPRDWIGGAAGDAAKSFNALQRRGPKERYEIPYASLMLVALGDDTLDAFFFGDCTAIVKAPEGSVHILGEAIEAKTREREFIAGLATAHSQNPIAALRSGDAKPELITRRNKFNTPRGPRLFAPDPRCARHAQSARARIAPGATVLVASDGFLSLITDYARYTPASIAEAARDKGLGALVAEARAIEADDPDGVKFPRFKTNDDATAVLLQVIDARVEDEKSRRAA